MTEDQKEEMFGDGIYRYLKDSVEAFRHGRHRLWESQHDYAKLLVGLASSALVLSVTMIKTLSGPSSEIDVGILLKVSWGLQVLSIISSVTALWMSTRLNQVDLIPDEVHKEWIDILGQRIVRELPDDTDFEDDNEFVEKIEQVEAKYRELLFENADDDRVVRQGEILRLEKWVVRLVLGASYLFAVSLLLLLLWAIQA